MYLPDHEIEDAIASGHIGVDPYDPAMVQPASLDVRLASTFRTYRRSQFGPWNVELCRIPDDITEEVDGSDGFILRPGEFALASTMEAVRIPHDLVATYEGRSTIARLGLLTHITAGFVDSGFSGTITLELANVGPLNLTLCPGESIGQLAFQRLTSPCARPYGSPNLHSRYQGQTGPTPPRAKATR